VECLTAKEKKKGEKKGRKTWLSPRPSYRLGEKKKKKEGHIALHALSKEKSVKREKRASHARFLPELLLEKGKHPFVKEDKKKEKRKANVPCIYPWRGGKKKENFLLKSEKRRKKGGRRLPGVDLSLSKKKKGRKRAR